MKGCQTNFIIEYAIICILLIRCYCRLIYMINVVNVFKLHDVFLNG
jgi:hypothetical protein